MCDGHSIILLKEKGIYLKSVSSTFLINSRAFVTIWRDPVFAVQFFSEITGNTGNYVNPNKKGNLE